MDIIVYAFTRAFFGMLLLLPDNFRVRTIGLMVNVFVTLTPLKKVAKQNLDLVFPHESAEWKRDILRKSSDSFARMISDSIRMPTIGPAWIKDNVDFVQLAEINKIRKAAAPTGILLAAAHLGSFELLAHVLAYTFGPLSFVVRDFKLARLDAWWRQRREANGNKVISRKGASRQILNCLKSGRDAGILFDQNIRREYAVFVNFFGRKAATTRTLALSSIKAETPVVLINLLYLPDGRYAVLTDTFDFSKIIQNSEINLDTRLQMITQEITDRLEALIRKYPEQWFWWHRRWKTTPAGIPEDFYA